MAEETKAVVYDIVIHAKRMKGTSSKSGKAYNFLTFEGFDVHQHKCQFKFKSDCNDVPRDEGDYLIRVDKRFINRDKRTRFNEYWIAQLVSVEPYVPQFAENTEDLPF